ncbi:MULTISPECIES: P-II family nitrogen regulator [Clostridium]|uniref:P-II family nitrogen regulator n=1 Tax=Clostridium TaxID=1485 RepID=UPI000A271112|nr:MULTISPECIES: P-II family nitrogen regulator [Clostridium]MDU7338508.1 P-II family nitrogen regulator [Clostridium sp.]
MEQLFAHSMILVIANQGFSAEIMEAAKAAGATGGTVIHATGSGLENLETFFGMTLKPEKELILILTQQSLKNGIMQAVMKVHGSGTDADAFVFSLPVDQVVGLTSAKENK